MAVIRSYCSSATNIEERTPVLSKLSACQSIGFIIGPVLQAALVPIGYPGLVNVTEFHFNMYTAPALISVLIYLGLAILYLVYFNEYVVLDNATQIDAKLVENNNINDSSIESLKNLPPPDYWAIGLTLLLFFINCFLFSFYETLSSPLTIDMYAWSKTQATLYNGIILGVIGIGSVAVVLFVSFLSRKYYYYYCYYCCYNYNLNIYLK
jgi:MFS transporter, ceroid-lipofuscinosis neuronal protein 7